MESMVNIIKTVEENIKELKMKAKENAKALAALMQEQENIDNNLKMFEKVLEDLTRTKNEEIQVVMAEKPVKEEIVMMTKNRGTKQRVAVNAIDEHGDKIAEYQSSVEAATDLKLSAATVCKRVNGMDRNEQIRKFGYALVKAG